MTNLNDWPIGAQVKAIEPLYGTVVTGKDEHGLNQYGKDIVVPAGSLGTIKQHFDDGRILVSFPCDPNCGHTFAEPEKFLKLVTKLSRPQNNVINVFYRWDNCRVLAFPDTKTKSVRYAVEFWNNGGRKRQIYPNPRTVVSLIRHGILIHNAKLGSYELASEWQPKIRNSESEAAQ